LQFLIRRRWWLRGRLHRFAHRWLIVRPRAWWFQQLWRQLQRGCDIHRCAGRNGGCGSRLLKLRHHHQRRQKRLNGRRLSIRGLNLGWSRTRGRRRRSCSRGSCCHRRRLWLGSRGLRSHTARHQRCRRQLTTRANHARKRAIAIAFFFVEDGKLREKEIRGRPGRSRRSRLHQQHPRPSFGFGRHAHPLPAAGTLNFCADLSPSDAQPGPATFAGELDRHRLG